MTDIGKGKAESGKRCCRVAQATTARSFPFPLSPFPFRRKALTLVELMVAIAIMGILASLLLGAAAVASEVARNARSKSLIARLHTLLIERYDGYRNQRVELHARDSNNNGVVDWMELLGTDTNPNDNLSDYTGLPVMAPDNRLIQAAGRLAGLRETMKLEMPDRWSDILGAPVGSPPQLNPVFLERSPALRDTYLRAYNRMLTRNPVPTTAEIVENESAECLYLIIMNATGDGEARGMFKPNDIGDTDEDGAPEFIDGWGKPISFLRWAPGFDSDAQLSIASLTRLRAKPNGDTVVAQAILDDHDPFDLFRLDRPTTTTLRGWRLLPLIVSGGGDEEIGLRFYGLRPTTLNPYLDIGSGNYLGEATDNPDPTDLTQNFDAELAGDNITNHNVGELSRK